MSAEEKKSHVTTEPKAKGGTAIAARKPTETSALGKKLLEYWENIKQGQSKITWYVLGGAAVILVLVGVWWYFSNASKKKDSGRWAGLWLLGDQVAGAESDDPRQPLARPQDKAVRTFDDYIKTNEGKAQARMARLEEARFLMSQSVPQLGGQGAAAARANIKRAAEEFEKLIPEFSDTPQLLAQVLYDAGLAREMLGQVDDARKHYDRLVSEKEVRVTFQAQDAQARIDALNDPGKRKSNEELYKKLQEAAPAPSLPAGHPPLTP